MRETEDKLQLFQYSSEQQDCQEYSNQMVSQSLSHSESSSEKAFHHFLHLKFVLGVWTTKKSNKYFGITEFLGLAFFLMKQLSDVELYTSEIAAKHREVTIQRQTEAAADRQYWHGEPGGQGAGQLHLRPPPSHRDWGTELNNQGTYYFSWYNLCSLFCLCSGY